MALALVLAGCGGTGAGSSAGSSSRTLTGSGQASQAAAGNSFAWLVPHAAPSGWRLARIPTGAAMSYPSGWSSSPGDAGTASAVLLGPKGLVIGYLNITPHQGDESLGNWSSFRVSHNTGEGDSEEHREGSAEGLHFRTGKGSCVRDSYATITHAHYVELACLVNGTKASTVIVAAALRSDWEGLAPQLEQAVSSFTT